MAGQRDTKPKPPRLNRSPGPGVPDAPARGMADKYNWDEAKEYAEGAQRFGRVEWRVTQAAREALAAIQGEEANTLRLAEAIGKSRLKEEDPELWRQADDLTPHQRLEAFKLAVSYLEDGEGHATAIRRAIRKIQGNADH